MKQSIWILIVTTAVTSAAWSGTASDAPSLDPGNVRYLTNEITGRQALTVSPEVALRFSATLEAEGLGDQWLERLYASLSNGPEPAAQGSATCTSLVIDGANFRIAHDTMNPAPALDSRTGERWVRFSLENAQKIETYLSAEGYDRARIVNVLFGLQLASDDATASSPVLPLYGVGVGDGGVVAPEFDEMPGSSSVSTFWWWDPEVEDVAPLSPGCGKCLSGHKCFIGGECCDTGEPFGATSCVICNWSIDCCSGGNSETALQCQKCASCTPPGIN